MTTLMTSIKTNLINLLHRTTRERTVFDEQYAPDNDAFPIWATRLLFNLLYGSVLISIIGYVAASMLASDSGLDTWMVYKIAGLYADLCHIAGACNIQMLHAASVVALCMVSMVFVMMWEAFDFLPRRDKFYDLHAHLDLISEQIETDYKRLKILEERVEEVESAVKEADDRVDIVMTVEAKDRDNDRDAATA